MFMEAFPCLRRINQDLLWLHVLTTTVMYAKYVVEGRSEPRFPMFQGINKYLLTAP